MPAATNGASKSGKPGGPQSVDTSLYGQPSGAALALAHKHTSEQPLKLYGGWFCPFVQRTWITLEEKRIPYQYIEINPYHKDPEFLKLNPRGLVPTLAVQVDNGQNAKVDKALYESVVVAEYLDEVYADESQYGTRLLPEGTSSAEAYERARCRLWIDHISSRIVPAFYRWIQHTDEKEYSIHEAREAWWKAVMTLVGEMPSANAGPWFLGSRFSLVDIALAPWAMRLFLMDRYKPGGVGEATEDVDRWQRWTIWYQAIKKRSSVTDTWSEDEKYVEAYKRYAEDTTGSEVGQATRGGKSLP